LSYVLAGKKSISFPKSLLFISNQGDYIVAFFSGYMPPEYAMRGQFSVKSDVFSFGILVLEIVSGKKNTDLYQSKHAVDVLSLVSINNSTFFLPLFWYQTYSFSAQLHTISVGEEMRHS